MYITKSAKGLLSTRPNSSDNICGIAPFLSAASVVDCGKCASAHARRINARSKDPTQQTTSQQERYGEFLPTGQTRKPSSTKQSGVELVRSRTQTYLQVGFVPQFTEPCSLELVKQTLHKGKGVNRACHCSLWLLCLNTTQPT